MNHPSLPPLVYACSGASSAGQLANDLALQLDRTGEAEMSCIAGVGGDVTPLVRLAQSGRPILALDGCPLRCVAHTLGRHGLSPTWHLDLADLGVVKRRHQDFDPADSARILEVIQERLRSTPGADPAQGGRPATAPGSP